QTVLDREQTGGDAVTRGNLAVDVLDVIARRLGRYAETFRDPLRRKASSEQPEHFYFSGGEARRSVASLASTMARGAEHGVDDLVIQSSGSCLVPDHLRCIERRAGCPVWPRLEQCLVDVGGGEDSP